jgi:hypothetical protein
MITRTGKLDEIKTVAERVLPCWRCGLLAGLDVSIERGAQSDQLRDHLIQIFHDQVEVDRRPVRLRPARTSAARSSLTFE